jgi:hypothetical protein
MAYVDFAVESAKIGEKEKKMKKEQRRYYTAFTASLRQ